MESMNIYTFGQFLSTVTVDSIHETKHFRERERLRFGDEFAKEMYYFVFECVPVAIIQQDKQKFKVLYSYNDKYDITVVFGVKDEYPQKLSLITCYKVESKRRLRDNDQK